MVSGSSKEKECFPVQDINKSLPPAVVENILGFHAITGFDTVSSFAGHSRKRMLGVYTCNNQDCCTALHGVGRDGPLSDVQEFVCMLYNLHATVQVSTELHHLFQKGEKVLEMLSPTSDALELHMLRANYQAIYDCRQIRLM